jgi:hypothetical protein
MTGKSKGAKAGLCCEGFKFVGIGVHFTNISLAEAVPVMRVFLNSRAFKSPDRG